MAKRPEVFIVTGPYAGRSFEVKEGGVRLGRSSSNDVQIPDEELSRNHCLFEPVGEDGLRLTDLASANGTILNGALVGNEPVALKEGDSIEVGKTTLRVGANFESDPTVCVGRVDLGLGTAAKEVQDAPPKPRRSPAFLALAGVAAVAVAGAVAVIALAPSGGEEAPAVRTVAEEPLVLREFVYEIVKANQRSIFRYELSLSADGVLSVRVDDVPGENRHLTKDVRLDEASWDELNGILDFKLIKVIDREYVGPDPEPEALDSRTLRIVYSGRARTIRVVNTEDPASFKPIREKLETFAKNALGIWAIQYPREKLVQLAAESVEQGDMKWTDRDAQHGNLAAAISAYREALFYLETVNPKPESHAAATEGLRRAQEELEKRVKDQRFAADRAMNLGRWEDAVRELRVLLEMVPERTDERNRDAREKLLSAEKNLKKGAN